MTAPDTNTPRDLTDDDIEKIAEASDREWYSKQTDTLWVLGFARAIEAKIRAADREARPAPATSVVPEHVEQAAFEKWLRIERPSGSVESVTDQWKASHEYQELHEDAASTPPAEAQPRNEAAGLPAWEREAMGLKPWDQSAADKRPVYAGPQAASEARATGDAAALLTELLACRISDMRRKGPESEHGQWFSITVRGELLGRLRAALSAGWIDTGPCVLCSGTGRCYTPSDLATAAPPVAPGAKAKFFSDAIDRFDAQATAKGYEDIHSALDAAPDRAATGAAGEPQPREGWKLVPVEPTPDMKRAADAYANDTASMPKGIWWWGRVYETMLAAAPQADSGAAGGQGDSNG